LLSVAQPITIRYGTLCHIQWLYLAVHGCKTYLNLSLNSAHWPGRQNQSAGHPMNVQCQASFTYVTSVNHSDRVRVRGVRLGEGSQTRPKKRHASVAQTCSHELLQKLMTCTGMFAQKRHFLFYPGRYPVSRYLWAVALYPLSHHKQKHLVYGIMCNKPLLHIPGRGAV
jgi:hypothetical protein